MSMHTILTRIRDLRIPERAKADLVLLAHISKRMVAAILNFIMRHRHLSEALVLGAVVAFLLSQLPFIGAFLGLVALVTAAALGLLREFHSQITNTFRIVPL